MRERLAHAHRLFRRHVLRGDNRAYISPVMLRHIARYEFAAEHARGRVLDAACGAGYGKELLQAASYTGIDIDPAAIAFATRNYGDGYRRASVVDIPAHNDSFDAVVSFETLEHLDHPELALNEFSRILKPGGVLVGSIPLNHPDTVFHRRIYRFSDVANLIGGSPFTLRTVVHQRGASFAPVDDVADDEGGTLVFLAAH